MSRVLFDSCNLIMQWFVTPWMNGGMMQSIIRTLIEMIIHSNRYLKCSINHAQLIWHIYLHFVPFIGKGINFNDLGVGRT